MVLNFTRNEIDVYLGRTDRRVVHSYGIEFENLFYNNDELAVVRRLMSPYDRGRKALPSDDPARVDPTSTADGKVFLKFNPADLGQIWVLNPLDRTYISVEAVLKEYATGLSLRRHKLNVAYARKLVESVVDETALLRAHAEINELISKASISDAERLGKALGRSLGLSLPSPDTPTPEQDAPPAAGLPAASPNASPDSSDVISPAAPIPTGDVAPAPQISSDDYDDLSAEADAWSK